MAELIGTMRAIAAGDDVAATPALAAEVLAIGASRRVARDYFLVDIALYDYAGDTALHIAAAAYRTRLVRALLARGADVRAKNRRGAEPLHYAVDGGPCAPTWNPRAQVATIACLIGAGADPNAVDRGGVAPLHRAVRNRCAAAVKALLDGGADARKKNGSGSTARQLAGMTTGRGGTGSPAAKAEQEKIVKLLARYA